MNKEWNLRLMIAFSLTSFILLAPYAAAQKQNLQGSSSLIPDSTSLVNLDVPFQILFDHVDGSSSREMMILVNEKYYDLCDLKILFSQMRRSFSATNLKVSVFTDRDTLDAMVKFRRNQLSSGRIETIMSDEGTKVQLQRLRELGYPENLKGRRAIYSRFLIGYETREEYIDYMPDAKTSDFIRINVQ